jgi:hypothetical protein
MYIHHGELKGRLMRKLESLLGKYKNMLGGFTRDVFF